MFIQNVICIETRLQQRQNLSCFPTELGMSQCTYSGSRKHLVLGWGWSWIWDHQSDRRRHNYIHMT